MVGPGEMRQQSDLSTRYLLSTQISTTRDLQIMATWQCFYFTAHLFCIQNSLWRDQMCSGVWTILGSDNCCATVRSGSSPLFSWTCIWFKTNPLQTVHPSLSAGQKGVCCAIPHTQCAAQDAQRVKLYRFSKSSRVEFWLIKPTLLLCTK